MEDSVQIGANVERRIQNIVQAVIIALLLWVGYSMIDLVKSVTRLEVRNEQTSIDINGLKTELVTLRSQFANVTLAATTAATAATAASAVAATAVSTAAALIGARKAEGGRP